MHALLHFISNATHRYRDELLAAQFALDVVRAILHVHVLTPTRYEAPPRKMDRNQEASKENDGLAYRLGDSDDSERDKEWKTRDSAVYAMLRAFGNARLGS